MRRSSTHKKKRKVYSSLGPRKLLCPPRRFWFQTHNSGRERLVGGAQATSGQRPEAQAAVEVLAASRRPRSRAAATSRGAGARLPGCHRLPRSTRVPPSPPTKGSGGGALDTPGTAEGLSSERVTAATCSCRERRPAASEAIRSAGWL